MPGGFLAALIALVRLDGLIRCHASLRRCIPGVSGHAILRSPRLHDRVTKCASSLPAETAPGAIDAKRPAYAKVERQPRCCALFARRQTRDDDTSMSVRRLARVIVTEVERT